MESEDRSKEQEPIKNIFNVTPESIKNSNNEANSPEEPAKKKRKRFSFEEKKKILEELNTTSPESICEKYQFSERALRKWRSEKARIRKIAKNSYFKNLKKKTDTQEMDDAMYEWFCKNSKSGISISGSVVRRQALIVDKTLHKYKKFKASEGWLSGWKKRRKMRGLKITGESVSVYKL